MTDHTTAIMVTLVPGPTFAYALRCACGYIATGSRVTAVQQGIVDHLRYAENDDALSGAPSSDSTTQVPRP